MIKYYNLFNFMVNIQLFKLSLPIMQIYLYRSYVLIINIYLFITIFIGLMRIFYQNTAAVRYIVNRYK